MIQYIPYISLIIIEKLEIYIKGYENIREINAKCT